MTWGIGPWGAGSPWGTGVTLPPPTLIGVSPAIVDTEGGSGITLLGTNFYDPMTVDVLHGGLVVGTGIIFDPEFDLQQNRVYVGLPALAVGFYDLQVTTDGGSSPILVGALEYRVFANDFKVVSVRSKWAAVWNTGPRILSGG